MFLHPAADRTRLSPPIGFVAMFKHSRLSACVWQARHESLQYVLARTEPCEGAVALGWCIGHTRVWNGTLIRAQ